MDGLQDGPGGRRAAFRRSVEMARRGSSAAPVLVVVVVVVLFGVSGGLLWLAGYNYEGLSGSVVTKIHPSTYLIVAAVLWVAVASGNPVGYAVRAARRRPASFFILVATAGLFAHIVVRASPGMAGAIDTYLAPPLLVVLLADIDEPGMRRIEIALHALMTANALLGLAEFALGVRIFPYRFDGAVFPFDTRSSALQGHPLVNALVTCCYVLALLNGCRSLPQTMRLPLILLQFAALVTFGGRTGMVAALVLGGVWLAGAAHRMLRAGRVPLLAAAAALILVALVPVAIGGLAAGGFFDALLARFEADGGSAHARIEMFAMFDTLPLRDLLVGPDTALIESLRRVNGLEWGIENPVIKTLLYQGLLITVLMTVAVTLFLREIARLCAPGVWLPMLAFVVLLNTSESLASKTTVLSKFAVTILCLYRPWPRRVTRAAATAPTPR